MTTWAQTSQGARELDRAAAMEAAARAAQQQSVAREAEAMAQLRIEQAQALAAEQARERESARRAVLAEQARARREETDQRRALRRADRAAAWTRRRPLLVVIPMMATSAAVALPAQFAYYESATHSTWSAVTIAGMVEGGTWLGAALEAAALNRAQPAGFYRALTWGLASVAAAVNLAHGLSMTGGGWQVGAVFALASLMGVTAWSAYMRLRTHQDSGVSAEQLRLAAWRRLRYPRLSWRAASLRAAIGPSLSVQDAWVQVWEEHHVPARLQPVDPVKAVDPVEHQPVTTAPVEAGDPVVMLDLLDLSSGQHLDPPAAVGSVAAEVAALTVGASTRAPVEARPVVPVWIEPPAVQAVELDPLDPDQDEVDPLTEELLADLASAIEAGDLPDDASVEAVRKHLGIAWRTAKSLLEERNRAGQARDSGLELVSA